MTARAAEKMMRQRLRLTIRGAVQGVGFRPFVFACAKQCNLRGFVGNETGGVFVEAEGSAENLQKFQRLLSENAPPLSHITSIKIDKIPTKNEPNFYIAKSKRQNEENTLIAPDAATCADCLRELFDEKDRRFRYPFINCTNCGPRFTITKDIPYDRPNTTMSVFEMCDLCRSEYENPLDRRFHAQPNACPKCGPKVWFIGENKKEVYGEDAILETQKFLSEGKIIAVKGIGGFHLACDARNDTALRNLRERKGRIDKPFAVMCRDLKAAKKLVEINEAEQNLLSGKERPIVLLRKKRNADVSNLIAPGNQFLGVMLPYSPLHYLLLNSIEEKFQNLDCLVMTSGNFTDEPIAKDNGEASEKLKNLADAFLMHDREIFVPCDDSVIRVVQSPKSKDKRPKTENQILPIRRSRGYAPFPVELPFKLPPVLAVGGELKAAFCLAKDEFAFMSQHIGDMENLETLQAFEKSFEQMRKLFRIEPEIVAFDAHPAYLSSRWARENATKVFQSDVKLVAVQHHHAHIAAVMAENGLKESEKVIGFAFDGTGYGADGAIWGGEVLIGGYQNFERAAHLRYVPLAGGDASVKKPYRTALAYLRQAGVEWNETLPTVAACPQTERKILLKQFENNFNVAPTSSFGRLFDAVASIAGVRQMITYEAQGAIELESLLDESMRDAYKFDLIKNEPMEIDADGLIRAVAEDVLRGISIGKISAKFNSAAADLILRLALIFRKKTGLNQIALSGGCFQNVALLQASLQRLGENDFEVLTHRLVPPNDGGLALGQAVIASQHL